MLIILTKCLNVTILTFIYNNDTEQEYNTISVVI